MWRKKQEDASREEWNANRTLTEETPAKTTRRTFFRACVFTIFLPHIWNGFIFFCGFYNVFRVPCIVLVSEMLSFTMVTKFNYFLIWKLHRFVLYEVVSKASRGSLLQQWFIRFLVFFQSNVFQKQFFECSECIHRSTLFFRHCVAFTNLGSNGQWQAPNWSSGYWTNATAIAAHTAATEDWPRLYALWSLTLV